MSDGLPMSDGRPTGTGNRAAFSGLIFLSGARHAALVIASRPPRRVTAWRTRQVAAWSTPDDIVVTNARVVVAWQDPGISS
jgi:hypothetical protein